MARRERVEGEEGRRRGTLAADLLQNRHAVAFEIRIRLFCFRVKCRRSPLGFRFRERCTISRLRPTDDMGFIYAFSI